MGQGFLGRSINFLLLGLAVVLISVTVAQAKPWCPVDPQTQRFVIITDATFGDAVLDRQTLLLWQRSPQSTADGTRDWSGAWERCVNADTAGVLGWRLPTAEELTSLVFSGHDVLPVGHPFQSVNITCVGDGGFYWTSTDGTVPGEVFALQLCGPDPQGDSDQKTNIYNYWCVRGGKGASYTSAN